jgi:hypothetical protein
VTPPELDDDHVAAICGVLTEHQVAFAVIGGVAARLHNTGHATVDIDVCPSRAKDNLVRLTSALGKLGARLRVEGDPDGVGFDPHADLLINVTTMTLITQSTARSTFASRPPASPAGTTNSRHARSQSISLMPM